MERKSAAWELERDALLSPSPESCKPIQWGDPTDPFLLFSTAGNSFCPRGFAIPWPFPGVLLTPHSGCRSCPISGSLQDYFTCSLGFKEKFRRQTLFLIKRWGGTSAKKGSLCRQHVRQTLRCVFGFIVKCFIPLCWKLLLGINQTGVCRARTELNDYNSENCYNLLIVVFARILPHNIWIRKSPFFCREGILCR